VSGRGNPLNFKTFIHDQQDIEVPGGWFCRNEAAPHENSTQFSSRRSECYECSQSPKQPYPSRSCQTQTRVELLPPDYVYSTGQIAFRIELRQHAHTISDGVPSASGMPTIRPLIGETAAEKPPRLSVTMTPCLNRPAFDEVRFMCSRITLGRVDLPTQPFNQLLEYLRCSRQNRGAQLIAFTVGQDPI
jgi:hypothetical protein